MNKFFGGVVFLFILLWPPGGEAETLKGVGHFNFSNWEGPTIPVYYVVPQNVSKDTPVLFVLHGAGRDPDRYQREWQELAQKHNIIALFPGFSRKDFPGREGYILGNVRDGEGNSIPEGQWAFTAIEKVFDFVKQDLNLRTEKYAFYGHSGGAQFVHRFLYFMPEARMSRVVIANAGWYTMPDKQVNFPFGLGNIPVSDENLKAMMEKRVIVLLGDNDRDVNQRSLNKTEGAMKQGVHRFERGHRFYREAIKSADRVGANFNWSLSIVPNAHHSNALMAEPSMAFLFGGPDNISTPLTPAEVKEYYNR